MKSSTQRPTIAGHSAQRLFWKAVLCCTVLATAATATNAAQAKNSRPPSLFAEEIGQPRGRLPAQAMTGQSRTVKINRANLRGSRLRLNLPGGLTVGAMRDRQEDLGNGRFAWVGHAIGNRAERVIIGVSGNAVAGTFVRKGKLFKLEPRADGSHVLSEVGVGDPAPGADPIAITAPVTEPATATDPAASGGLALGAATAADAGQQIIDVMVAYTPRVEQIYGAAGAEALIIQAVAETNQAYTNSGINPRLNLVHSVRTNYTESGDIYDDLSRLRSTNDGYMDELHSLRDSHGADLVSVLVDVSGYCGLAYRMDRLSAGFASSAFSVVDHGCATGYYSFGHELGHNQGAHHDPANGSGAIYSYAYGYQDPLKKFRTVMAFNCSGGCTRVDHFSNPNVFYNGTPTGDATYSDNTRTLNNTAATIAGFRAQVQQQPPEAPYGLDAAAASDSEIALSWVDDSSDETGFYLERSGTNQNFVQIASLPANSTSYLDDNLQADKIYYYRIRSFSSAGTSNYSNTAIIATDPAPEPIPNSPSGLNASATGTDRISVTWTDNANNEAGFTLQRSLNGSSGWANRANLGANVRSYLDTGLQADTAYYYRVRAYNDSGASGNSNTDSAATDPAPEPIPNSPSGLNASATGTDSISVTWTDNANNESGFSLQRSLNGSSGWANIATLGANVRSHLDTGLQADTAYYYRVSAYNDSGTSGNSNTDSAATDPAPEPIPSAPSGLNAFATGTDSISVTWTDNANNESGFSLQRSLNGSSGWANIATLGANVRSYLNTGLQAETLYYYRVRAFNNSGQSSYSTAGSASTDALPASKFVRQQDLFR